MSIAISSKSFLESLSFVSDPQTSLSSTPQAPDRVSLKPSTIHNPALQTHHFYRQQPLILTRNVSEKQKEKDPFWSILPPSYSDEEFLSVAFPAFAYANTLFFKSAYNIQVVVGDNEPEDRVVGRFRSAVLRAGVIQEAKRRRYFETNQEKRKRKAREASRRNRKRRPQPKASKQDKKEVPKGYEYEFQDDNWEFYDGEVPYC